MKICRLAAFFAVVAMASAVHAGSITLFDGDWHFTLGNPAGAQDSQFDDSLWSLVELPHDWSIAGPIEQSNPMGRAGGFFPAGVGWYRKTLTLPAAAAGQRVSLRFDGVYMSPTTVSGFACGCRQRPTEKWNPTHPLGSYPAIRSFGSLSMILAMNNTIGLRR